jgi:hypothetical protein
MNNRIESPNDGAPVDNQLEGSAPNYFELFRAFNSERTFFDFAGKVVTDTDHFLRPPGRTASAG